MREAFGTLVEPVAAPQVAAVKAAIGAASKLGEFAYQSCVSSRIAPLAYFTSPG